MQDTYVQPFEWQRLGWSSGTEAFQVGNLGVLVRHMNGTALCFIPGAVLAKDSDGCWTIISGMVWTSTETHGSSGFA